MKCGRKCATVNVSAPSEGSRQIVNTNKGTDLQPVSERLSLSIMRSRGGEDTPQTCRDVEFDSFFRVFDSVVLIRCCLFVLSVSNLGASWHRKQIRFFL